MKIKKPKLPPGNENLTKSWSAKIKGGSMDSSDLTAILSVRVCHFTKEDFKRDLQVHGQEYWSW